MPACLQDHLHLPHTPACSPTGYFLSPHPIVSGPSNAKVAMCRACEGCAVDKCTASGCSACTDVPTLSTMVDHPTVKGMAGQAVKVCRTASGQPKVRCGQHQQGSAMPSAWRTGQSLSYQPLYCFTPTYPHTYLAHPHPTPTGV